MDDDVAEASGKAMAAILLSNVVLGALVFRGVISPKQARAALDTARETAADLKPKDVAIAAVAALNGLETSWKKQEH